MVESGMRHHWLIGIAAVTTCLAGEPVPLWPQIAPGDTIDLGPELNMSKPGQGLVSGKPVIRLSNVSHPTITIYPARHRRSGAAVLVCPGGGYRVLAYDLEGTEVCQWLNSIGVTGILLKYRVPARPNRPNYEAPLQDAQRALSLARFHAPEWKIDTNRLGILGFSAGGQVAALASCRFDKRSYAPVDAADELSCRPDFTLLIYPAYLTLKEQPEKLVPELTISSNVPPTFLVQTEDDHIKVENSVCYDLALTSAFVPAELHVFAKGGHGYGLRPSANPVSHWPKLAEQWLLKWRMKNEK